MTAKKPYVDVTSWINAIWDAINELRDANKLRGTILGGHDRRIANLEQALGKGMYGEYAGGPEGRLVINDSADEECGHCD